MTLQEALNVSETFSGEDLGYINGLISAGNLKLRYSHRDDAASAVNDIRAQINTEIIRYVSSR